MQALNYEQFINDISLCSPEQRAISERESYARTLAQDLVNLQAMADTEEKQLVLHQEFARYRHGCYVRYTAYLQSRSRVISVLVAGPANFPNRRNHKANQASSKRLEEFLEFRTKALASIKRALQPELAPIMAGDDNAIERLQLKISEAEKLQEGMKAANQVIRKYKNLETQVVALTELGYSDAMVRELLTPNYLGNIGFEGWQLSNNNANIRRLKERLEAISQAKQQEATTASNESTGIRLEDCPADNRVRLFFPGKPDAVVRTELKASGYRWTPSMGCWQAYRNPRSQSLAQKMIGGSNGSN